MLTINIAVKTIYWLVIGPFKVHLPPLNQLKGFQSHHYFVARVSGCLATDILCHNTLATIRNIHHRGYQPIPTTFRLTPK